MKLSLKAKEGEVENLLLSIERMGGENSALAREVNKCQSDKAELKEKVEMVKREMVDMEKEQEKRLAKVEEQVRVMSGESSEPQKWFKVLSVVLRGELQK